MPIKTSEHTVEGDRYQFDFDMCRTWTQLDTRQDASYYGNWVCPQTLRLLSFTEGDVALQECDNQEEFIECLKNTLKWHLENGYNPSLDAHIDSQKGLFIAMGFESFIPPLSNIEDQCEFVGADLTKTQKSLGWQLI